MRIACLSLGAWLLCAQTVTASSLSDELAQERGVKSAKLDLLGRNKSAAVKPQIKACGAASGVAENSAAKPASNWSLTSSNDEVVHAPNNVQTMKQSLLEVSRMAADLRHKAAQQQGRNKKSCHVAILD